MVFDSDKNLVPKPTHQMEAKVHIGRGDSGLTVLCSNWNRINGQTNGCWRSSMVVQSSTKRTHFCAIHDAKQRPNANSTATQLSISLPWKYHIRITNSRQCSKRSPCTRTTFKLWTTQDITSTFFSQQSNSLTFRIITVQAIVRQLHL